MPLWTLGWKDVCWKDLRWKDLAKGAVFAALLLVTIRFGLRAAIQIVTRPEADQTGPPTLVLESLEQEVPAATGEAPLAVSFPVANSGQRRLVLRELRRPCCDPPGPEPTIVPPGGSARLVVHVNPQDLRKRGQHTIGFATNDPRCPEFALTIHLTGWQPKASPAGAHGDQSILVHRPNSAN